MSDTVNRQILLVEKPTGKLGPEHFKMVKGTVPEPGDVEVLVRTRYISLDAANRALARLRAEFGDDAVVQAKLANGHLPEARFTWEPLSRVKLPRNDLNRLNDLNVLNSPSAKVLVRRIMAKPISLPGGPRHTHEDGWLILGHKYGSVDKLSGPYVFAGGWWNKEIQRDYYYAETRRGAIAWVYYDRVRRRWFLQGWIE